MSKPIVWAIVFCHIYYFSRRTLKNDILIQRKEIQFDLQTLDLNVLTFSVFYR